MCLINKIYVDLKIYEKQDLGQNAAKIGFLEFNCMGEPAELRFLMPFSCTRKALKEWNQIQVHSLTITSIEKTSC